MMGVLRAFKGRRKLGQPRFSGLPREWRQRERVGISKWHLNYNSGDEIGHCNGEQGRE